VTSGIGRNGQERKDEFEEDQFEEDQFGYTDYSAFYAFMFSVSE
jgi:hypothetical protein